MKVIFLDIDGVMNSHIFYEKRYRKRWFKFNTYKFWIISKIRFIFNGFKHKAYSLKDWSPKKEAYMFSFKYLIKRLREDTDKLKWKWLSEFCNEYDYKICISSVWKDHVKDVNDWNRALISLGFNENIFAGRTGNRKTLRGEEIKEWMEDKEIENYAILDDDSDMLSEQISHFFLVDGWYGLTPNHLYRIHRLLN